jgi:protein gp37
MEKSKIGWTDHTWNPWWGCEKVSTECRHCYIGSIIKRSDKSRDPFSGPVRTGDATWKNPRRWDRKAEYTSERPRIFTCSMSDFFHQQADEWRADAWKVIRECKNLDWLILTKRSERIADCLPGDWGDGYSNVWLGVTCGIESSLSRVDELVRIPAHVRFISAEPLLGPIDFSNHLSTGGIDWVITGCEQAHKEKRRRMGLDWVREIDQQCRDANVAHFFKQHYAVNEAGIEIGTPVTNGILDGIAHQDWPRRGLSNEDEIIELDTWGAWHHQPVQIAE